MNQLVIVEEPAPEPQWIQKMRDQFPSRVHHIRMVDVYEDEMISPETHLGKKPFPCLDGVLVADYSKMDDDRYFIAYLTTVGGEEELFCHQCQKEGRPILSIAGWRRSPPKKKAPFCLACQEEMIQLLVDNDSKIQEALLPLGELWYCEEADCGAIHWLHSKRQETLLSKPASQIAQEVQEGKDPANLMDDSVALPVDRLIQALEDIMGWDEIDLAKRRDLEEALEVTGLVL